MKIDLNLLRAAEKGGAPASAIIAMIEQMLAAHEAKRASKRPIEGASKRKAVERKRKVVESDGNHRNEQRPSGLEPRPPGPEEPARARIFALRPRLVALGLSADRAGTMLGQWCKVTRDNAAAIETAIAGAELKQPADPIGYIRAVLQDRSSINGGKRSATMDAFDDLIAGAVGPVEGDPPMRDVTPRGGHVG